MTGVESCVERECSSCSKSSNHDSLRWNSILHFLLNKEINNFGSSLDTILIFLASIQNITFSPVDEMSPNFSCRELLGFRFQKHIIGGHLTSGLQFLSSGLHLSIYYTLEVIYILQYNIVQINIKYYLPMICTGGQHQTRSSYTDQN